ncbi:GspE/PulE family protein [Ramlibacter albus]|uniref:Flp pilus assembly complex ATPase component TadA n=1 Tax=Ramlibacter albus TaxID=2079448 RepID=A0A923MDY1_9BURK|nr:ATPase, T2SS/T4P/T4SS family [Ramlibacter albus]MBC5767664.1 Flp pilus assembly complex ATPase component TadA [Ramlibacter albus]
MSALAMPQPADASRSQWPSPHHMRLVDTGTPGEGERGMATLMGGEKMMGRVAEIDFDAQLLAFQGEAGPRRMIPFDTLRSLFLARTVELEGIPLAVPPGALAAKARPRKQRCIVRTRDGGSVEADVAAVLPRPSGLFLFVIGYGSSILRWFVPAQAIENYELADADAPPRAAATQGGAAFTPGATQETPAQVQTALERQKSLPRRRLGDLLVEDKLITPAQRDEAAERQKRDRHKLFGEILVDMGAVGPEAVRRVLVTQLGVPCVNLSRFQYDPNGLRALSAELARKHLAVPLYRSAKRIAIAIENPLSWQALHEIEFFCGLKVDPVFAAHDELEAAVDQLYGPAAGEKISQLVDRLDAEREADDAAPDLVAESDNTLVRLVNKMIMDAWQQGASDIHIESRGDDKASRIRLRTDGVMSTYIEVPRGYRAALVSRIKIMAGLDISERRRPQDGKIRFQDFGPRRMELRVLTMPTVNGLEDVVMRILAAPRALTMDQLGLSPRDLAQLRTMGARSYGLLFVCGPTGSGKTTTLHSVLASINTPDRKIWTVEDPVEITQEGLCQVQVNMQTGLTFAAALRSFLRADPDVTMVGETRDEETARTVIAASLTGHLVLSTMHTNSAVESITRLIDFGVDPFSFSDALLGVMGQRLVRRLCSCKESYEPGVEELQALAREWTLGSEEQPQNLVERWKARYSGPDGTLRLFRPAGCDACEHTGYRGRVGVYELLVGTPKMKAAIVAKAATAELVALACAEGMATLVQDGIEKILQGHADLVQVLASCR